MYTSGSASGQQNIQVQSEVMFENDSNVKQKSAVMDTHLLSISRYVHKNT